jgi:hypothetical protein
VYETSPESLTFAIPLNAAIPFLIGMVYAIPALLTVYGVRRTGGFAGMTGVERNLIAGLIFVFWPLPAAVLVLMGIGRLVWCVTGRDS